MAAPPAAELLSLEESDVQEEFFARGWTDGLPIVPPTPARVQAMLDAVGADDAELLIGYVPARRRGVTLRAAATNAVMAGCEPASFPVVLAALEAVFDPGFNLNGVLTSTGGAAICAIVSGPIADEIGMNGRFGALGPGNRANATIGRALRLVGVNVLDGAPVVRGGSDATALGHPGRYTFCFAEAPPPEPWLPLRICLGYGRDDTTVTVLPAEGPHQLAQQRTRSAQDVLRSFAASIRHPTWISTGKGGQGVLVLGPEHAGFCVAEGMTQAEVRELVCRETRVRADELVAAGVPLERTSAHDMTPGADGLLPGLASPDDLLLVTAGGEGAGWSAWIPSWAPLPHARFATRRVRPSGEPLPDCGPDGCLVPWREAG